MMTRRDWWLGVAVLVTALAIHAIIVMLASQRVESAIEGAFVPTPRPVASSR